LARRRPYDDRVGRRDLLQARRKVGRDSGSRGLLRGAFADDVADNDGARGNSNTHARWSRLPLWRSYGMHRIDDAHPRIDRSFGIVLVTARPAKIREHAVAHVPGDEPLVTNDDRRAGILIGADEV